MAKPHCMVIRRNDESTAFFKARIGMAVATLARIHQHKDLTVGAATMTHQGLRFDRAWSHSETDVPASVCVVASYASADSGLHIHAVALSELETVSRNPEVARLMFKFSTIYNQYQNRNGQDFELLQVIDTPTGEFDLEVLPMLRIRFADGFTTDAWPEEAVTSNVAAAAAKQALLAKASDKVRQLLELQLSTA